MQPANPVNSLAIPEQLDRDVSISPLEKALAVAGIQPQAFWTSFSPKDERQFAQYKRAMTKADHALADVIGSEINVEHAVFHRVLIKTGAPGEAVDAVRMVLIGSDGRSYATVGQVPVQGFCYLMAVRGVPPYIPPMRLKVVPITLRSKFRTFDFEYVPSEQAEHSNGQA